MERLYLAAKEMKNISGQSALARALNSSPQTVKNWEERGISKQGLLTAQMMLGINAVWLETGKGLKTTSNITEEESFHYVINDNDLKKVIEIYEVLPAQKRKELVRFAEKTMASHAVEAYKKAKGVDKQQKMG